MSTWSNIMFPNSNSPIMEQLIFFHDHIMMVMLLIIIITLYMMTNIFNNKLLSRYIMDNYFIETLWTIVPAVTLIYIALPSLRILYLMEETFNPSMTAKIIGHQWYWSYEYPNFNVDYDSFMMTDLNYTSFRLLDVDNRMIMPYNTNIQLLITSEDVIHSWAMLSLGIKMDAIPGRLNQTFFMANKPGLYFGQCSEICGANHSFMPIMLEITSINNFLTWIKSM
nr:cytochrome c oxidase subunit 2 [Chiropterargas confusus]